MKSKKVKFYRGDLELDELERFFLDSVYISIDTETTGLDVNNSELKLIQIASNKNCYLFKIDKRRNYPNLISLLNSTKIIKIFHNAIFDISFLLKTFPSLIFNNVRCTKISERLINQTTQDSSLKNIVKRYIDIELNKTEKLSNWSTTFYSKNQLKYAINDVIYLEKVWLKQKGILEKQKKLIIAKKCFMFIETQIILEGFNLNNIFRY